VLVEFASVDAGYTTVVGFTIGASMPVGIVLLEITVLLLA
jgi:hypothetical protein